MVDMQQAKKNHIWTDFVSSNPWLSMIFNALTGKYYREIEEGWPLNGSDNALRERVSIFILFRFMMEVSWFEYQFDRVFFPLSRFGICLKPPKLFWEGAL